MNLNNADTHRAVAFIMWKMSEMARRGLPGPARKDFPKAAREFREFFSGKRHEGYKPKRRRVT
jgi:hypothetical protein